LNVKRHPRPMKKWIFVIGLGVIMSGSALLGDASRFEETIAQFELDDVDNPPEPGAVLFVGSSSIRMWKNLEQDFPNVGPVLNRGFGGSTMKDLLEVMDRIVLPYAPSVIVVYEGDNDLAGKATPADVEADFDVFLDRVEDALPDTRVLILAVKPSYSRWTLLRQVRETNERLIGVAVAREKVEFVDTYRAMMGADESLPRGYFVNDGLHLNEVGYDLWVEVLTPWLEAAVER
jgi:lysophospholipase L1-like esterase